MKINRAKLTALRKEHDWTMEMLAKELANITPNYLYQMCSGRRRWQPWYVERLAVLLSVPVKELFREG